MRADRNARPASISNRADRSTASLAVDHSIASRRVGIKAVIVMPPAVRRWTQRDTQAPLSQI